MIVFIFSKVTNLQHVVLLKIALLYRYISKNLTAVAEQLCWNMHFGGCFLGKLLFLVLDKEKNELRSASYELLDLATRIFELVTCKFELVARVFKFVNCNSQHLFYFPTNHNIWNHFRKFILWIHSLFGILRSYFQ